LYRRIVPPRLPGLYFIGLVQPIGAVMPIAETQSQWVADLLQGRAKLPPEQQMNREIARYTSATTKRYGRSARHTIQVDFLPYLRQIRRDRKTDARHKASSVKRSLGQRAGQRVKQETAGPEIIRCGPDEPAGDKLQCARR